MKIILSHDVDHLYWSEHYFKDMYMPGTLFRNTKGLLRGQLSFKLYLKRLKVWGRIHNLPELISFYKSRNISSNFFFGMRNALGLSYSYKSSKKWIEQLIDEGHKIGVHGIAYQNMENIELEYRRFKELSSLEKFGIRTHYLRFAENTQDLFNKQGYTYDSSIDEIANAYKFGGMWNIPISIMDVSLVDNAQLNQSFNTWKENTLERLELAENKRIKYFVINFHDLYFSDNFPVIKEWLTWLVDLLKARNYEFTTFENAVNELDNLIPEN